MFDPLSLVAPYDMDGLQFIENLPIYATCQGTDEMLDLIREIQISGNYYWVGAAFPGSTQITVGGNQTVSGNIVVPSGSYITSLTGYVSNVQNVPSVKLKLFDKGSKASIFYGDYAYSDTVASLMQADANVGTNLNTPFGANLLLSPLIVTPPGIIGWEIVNLASVSATVQFMASLAVPVRGSTINQVVVSKG